MEDLQEKINLYRVKRARNFSISIMLYILAVAVLIALSILFDDKGAEIGVVLLFVFAAIATGLIIFTNMSIPQELIPYFKKQDFYSDYVKAERIISNDVKSDGNIFTENKSEASAKNTTPSKQNTSYVFSSIMKLYWLLVTIIYLGISFLTSRWDITWLTWLIAVAVEQAIRIIYSINKDNR
ncbi:MAG: hypothetical protein WCQ67_08235 [Treponema sp.]